MIKIQSISENMGHINHVSQLCAMLELYVEIYLSQNISFINQYLRSHKYIGYMSNHAGPRRCKCHPGTIFWHPLIELTQFWHPKSGFGARFL